MKKRGGKSKKKLFLIILIIVIILVLVGLTIKFARINGYVYVETSTYRNSYWTCPDGDRSEETSCKTYSSLLSTAETFCKNHCKDLSGNGYVQCNAAFHRGQLCNNEEPASDNPVSDDSQLNESQIEDEYSPIITPCYDSDSNLDTIGQLKTKGICTDSTGIHEDITVRNGVIREFSCRPENRPENQQYCSGLDYDCFSAELDSSSDGTCIEKYEAIAANSYEQNDSSAHPSNYTQTENYTYSNPNSDVYTSSINNSNENIMNQDNLTDGGLIQKILSWFKSLIS